MRFLEERTSETRPATNGVSSRTAKTERDLSNMESTLMFGADKRQPIGAVRVARVIAGPARTQKFTCTLLSCCSVAHGAFNGTSGTASLGCTRPFSIRYCSTCSPLISGNILSLISTQGESGCPLFVSISQRNAGLAMISFSVYGRLYLLSTARTPALQPQYVFR